MGKNKLLLPWQGKPILQHVIDIASNSSLHPLILVLGAEHERLQALIDCRSTTVVINHGFFRGYGSSLQTGLRAIPNSSRGAMFLLGDQPTVAVDTLERLISAFYKEPERWVAPTWEGRRGNPVITPASWFDRIFALDGDIGPRQHLKDPAANLKLVEVDDESVLFDIDDPGDYERLQKM
jgi:molybdenum cofactor cytidylyltransferase